MPLQIITPTTDQVFDIDTEPVMPVIPCRAQVTGVTPDPTPTLRFNWSIEIVETITADTCASSTIGNCRATAQANNVAGGAWQPQFTTVQGGRAVIRVTTIYQGQTLQAQVVIQIRGTNPPTADISAALGGAGSDGDQIACHESSRRQFSNGNPVLGPGGDVGLMQLCNPAATCEQRWNWRSNAAAGLALLAQKRVAARTYLNAHVVDGHYPNDQGFNDAEVLRRETIQRYNGGRYWQWDAAQSRWEAQPPNNYVQQVLSC
jgi:hypothetical protein